MVWVAGNDVLLVLETPWSRTPYSSAKWLICFVALCSTVISSSSVPCCIGRHPWHGSHRMDLPRRNCARAGRSHKVPGVEVALIKLVHPSITLHTCSSESSSFGSSSSMRHVLYCLLAFVQLHLDRWVLTHPNVRGVEFPFNHMFGKQEHNVPKGRAGWVC